MYLKTSHFDHDMLTATRLCLSSCTVSFSKTTFNMEERNVLFTTTISHTYYIHITYKKIDETS